MSPVADRRALGFALLAGPLMWSGQFALVYGLQAAGCASRWGLTEVVLHVASLLALAVVIWGGLVAWRGVRVYDGVAETLAGHGHLGGCLALSGLIVNVVFGLAIVLGDIPVFALRTCG